MSSYIFHSPLAPVDIPQVHITEFVLQKCETRPNHPAIVDGLSGTSLSFSELATRIRRVAGGMQARGFSSGDVLALIAPNCPDYAVVFHAVALCGGTVTTVNPTYGIAEVRQQLVDSKASWIVADQSCIAVAKQAMRGTSVSSLVNMQGNTAGTTVNGLLAEEIEQVRVDLHKQPVVLPYSSGTTGLPKGVMLSHQNLVANLVQLNSTLHSSDDEVGLAVLPFFHIFGMQALMGCLLSEGNTIVTVPRFDMAQALQLIEQYAVTQFYVVPPIVLGLAKSPLVDNYDLSSLRKIVSGAAPLGSELTAEASKRIDCPIVQAYGMTELSPASHITPGFDAKPGTSGVTVANTQSRIIDSKGNDLPADTEGQLLVKGPQVMIGYLNNKTATAETLDDDGWLYTGDLAMIDKDGYLTIVDRVKELIKYKGFQIAPAELEALIITHPDVADVAVVGIPDDEAGEVPKAYLVYKGDLGTLGKDALQQKSTEIKKFVSAELATYKSIHTVQWVDSIPKSASGKILRRVLRNKQPENAL
ncbi:MAG: AMP-binding protein [Granulosicoccus sp.]